MMTVETPLIALRRNGESEACDASSEPVTHRVSDVHPENKPFVWGDPFISCGGGIGLVHKERGDLVPLQHAAMSEIEVTETTTLSLERESSSNVQFLFLLLQNLPMSLRQVKGKFLDPVLTLHERRLALSINQPLKFS